MADEYIRLDTTIMGIDGLINEAPTGSQARALLCAKDMIYDQQRYVSEMKPVKRGEWVCNEELYYNGMAKCSCCKAEFYVEDLQALQGDAEYVKFCPNCGADMINPEAIKG